MSSPAEAGPLSTHYRKGDAVVVTIEKIVPRGFGLGFAENLTVLVPLAAVGDVVRVRIRECKRRLAFAEIIEVQRAGPARTAAPCKYYGVCGGCDLQHLTYQAQTEAKVGIIRDCLTRIGKIEFEDEIRIIASPQIFEYRSRARWHVDADRRTIGYKRRDSNAVVDIETCAVLTPGLQSALDYLRISTDWDALKSGLHEVEAVSGEGGRVSTHVVGKNGDAAEIDIDLAGERYSYSAETFFQANRSLVPQLIEVALGDTAGAKAFDLYCGVGLFSLPLARRFDHVFAVEENKYAVGIARKNAGNARIANLEIVNRSVGRFVHSRKFADADLVLLDPPRTGSEDGVIEAIAACKPSQISYISCEPSILARDLHRLLDSDYSIASITAVDLFPQTHHVETVVHLIR